MNCKCATYKALVQRGSHPFSDGDGFCYDVDCGDEAAQTIMNCYIDDWGPDTPITCQQNNFSNRWAYGFWIYSSNLFNTGPCYNFVNWGNGQGLPDKNRIRNPYEYLAYLESQGVDVSGAYEFDTDAKDVTLSE